MNYRHHFHAGNFADLFKHLLLVLCLEKLHEKDSSFLAIDCHSGAGKYFLESYEAQRSNEAALGIIKLLSNQNFIEFLPPSYLSILAKLNCCTVDHLSNRLKYYPGSPLIIKNFLRKQDRAIFAESQNQVFVELKRNFAGNQKISCLNQDGYLLLKSALPPIEKRAIILLDPAFEKLESKISLDYQKSVEALKWGRKRFENGIFLLWYPLIKGEEELQKWFYQEVSEIGFKNICHLTSDFVLQSKSFVDCGQQNQAPNQQKINNHQNYQKLSPQNFEENLISGRIGKKMNRCAMSIFNAPWQIEEKFTEIWLRISEIIFS